MLEFFERIFGRDNDKEKSGKVAKDRLQFVLVQDRISLPADRLQEMKKGDYPGNLQICCC